MHHKHVLLNHLDKPPRVLIFTYDQVGGFLGLFLMGTLPFNSPELGILFGVLWTLLLPSFKKRIGAGSWRCLFYWHFPTSDTSMGYVIPSHIREWIG